MESNNRLTQSSGRAIGGGTAAGVAIANQPDYARQFDRIDNLAILAVGIHHRLDSMLDRAFGAVPEPQLANNVKGVPSGAVAKIDDRLDTLSMTLDGILNLVSRLEKFI